MKLYVFCIAALAFALASQGMAQVTTATFYGTVTDSSGAVAPGSSVTLVHEATGTSVTKVADPQGEFVFDFLRVGGYSLKIEAAGFKRYENTGIELVAGQQVRQIFALEVGSVNETVIVEASAPLVNTVSSEQINTFETARVKELPVARRNFSTLLRIGTGVSYTGDSVRMNGVGKNGVSFNVDGTDAGGNPEGRASSNFGTPNLIDIMSLEAIQEVQTIKGVAPAEYGNIVGGQVNLLSRSGTNDWHGSLFENFQAENLNARNQRLANKPGLTFNQYGGSIGGPIKRNRIFAFGVFEGYKERAFTLVQDNLPTPRLRADMLRATPSYALLLDYLPVPSEPYAATADIGLYRDARSSSRNDSHADTKTDVRIGSSSQLSFTYSRGRPTQLIPRSYLNGANDRNFLIWDERGTTGFTTAGSNWSSETRFGYHLADTSREDKFFFNQFDPSKKTEILPFGRRVGRIGTNLGWNSPDHEMYLLEGRTWNFDQKYGRHTGKHALKFGGSVRQDCCQKTNPEGPLFTYTGRADLVNNIPTEVAPVFGNGDFQAKQYSIGIFAQDDWRARPNLTLNIGLRYDYFSNLVPKGREKAPESGLYNPDDLLNTTTFAVGKVRDRNNPYNADGWVNLGPRLGFAYDPDGKGKTSIRGGFGILFSGQVSGAFQAGVQPSPLIPFRIRFSKLDAARLGLGWGGYSDDIAATLERDSKARGVTNTFSIYNPRIQNPYTMQYTLGFQRELAPGLALESSFVGTRGVKFLMHRWVNEPDRITGIRPNPLLNANYYVDSSQQSVYLSWQTSLRKRFSHGVTGSAHYTYGKGLSTSGGDIGAYYQGDGASRTQDFNNPLADRGPNTGDITHYFITEWVYELPRLKSWKAVARHSLGGWQVTGIFLARSGDPVNLSETSARQVSRPDYIGGEVYKNDYRKTLQYLNRSAFALVPLGDISRASVRPGNVGNGAIRNPGAVNFDLSIAKNFAVTERVRLQIRTDMFNALNHTNLTGLRTSLNDAFFGQLLGTAGARVIQLNARFSF